MPYTTELTIDDHQDFLRMLGGRVAGALVFLMSLASLGFILFAAYGAGLFIVALVESWRTGALEVILQTPSLIVSLVIALILLPVVFLLLRWAVRFVLRAGKGLKVDAIDETYLRDGLNIGAYQFELLADGLRVVHPLQESHYTWAAFEGLRETDKTLFLMLDPKRGVIIPKRAFADDQAFQELKAHAERAIGARA